MKKNGIIVLSGGMDSVTLLYENAKKIALAISFDYGSNHNGKEIPFARYHCRKLGIPHRVVRLDFMKEFRSSLLQGAAAVPEGHYAAENMKSTVVPFRNGIMLAVAAGFAESAGLKKIYIASHFGDHSIYPDCRKAFTDAIGKAVRLGTYAKVEILAPYSSITKDRIAAKGAKLGIDYAKTWSCYKGGKFHCGKCGTCVERKEAFRLAGVADPTRYGD